MTTIWLENAPNEFIEASGIKFAYRRLGPREGMPLILQTVLTEDGYMFVRYLVGTGSIPIPK